MRFNRKHLLLVVVIAMIALAGCAEEASNEDAGENLGDDTGIDVSGVETGGKMGSPSTNRTSRKA